MRIRDAAELDRLDFAKGDGLLPVVAQHARTGEVLMVAWTDRTALERTLEEGVMWYWSRSRAEHWRKGDTSGNTQRLVSLHEDCDRDTVLALVEPTGPSCHTGAWSCFGAAPTLAALDGTIAARAGDGSAAESYTRRLLEDRNLRLKKLGEEAVELVLALADGDAERTAEEAADVLYHVLVACRAEGVAADDVLRVLAERGAG
ncbi:MAG: bifunctional phosphoribosyl-AMP cyclohydrolase/phosphoribosyl-ATP diphosphatase HisIE [Gemmatimonadota bacterium]